MARSYNESWLQKSYFRSMMFAIFMNIIFAVCLDSKYNSGKASCIILIIGGIIEILTIIAFITQRLDAEEKRKILMNGNKSD